jgi:hypothetical protein
MTSALQFPCQGTLGRQVPTTVPMNHQHPHRLGSLHHYSAADFAAPSIAV